ncbi:MAG: hypothetical protein CMD88_05150 [Gammaproteobacteria bacterium]|nr:hypothetical protein [Gammaproteobacteria bacterium]|tara:strand:+ start:44341 stop:45093 length:753 start_codon:yes stop_codon:yes gene_type:complete
MTNINLIQITDLHLTKSKNTIIQGVNTYVSAKNVINEIKTKQKKIDSLILTGDLVDDETDLGYQNLKTLLFGIKCPIYLIPGNHDSPAAIKSICDDRIKFTNSFILNNDWVMFLFNTKKIGTHSGIFSEDDIEKLNKLLEKHTEKNFIIFLHHPPISINSPWMDTMSIMNPNELYSLTKKYTSIKGIFCGHVHQEFESTINNAKFYTTPSTCHQYKPKADKFSLDLNLNAGYRYITLKNDGEIITSVFRL